jgi:hypothetical protein
VHGAVLGGREVFASGQRVVWVHHLITRRSGPFNFINTPDQILSLLNLFRLVNLLIHCLIRSASGRAMLTV